MTSPVSSEARANGTMTYQPVSSIAIQQARTVWVSWQVWVAIARAKYAMTVPSQPTEEVTCAVSANLRSPGFMVMIAAPPYFL
ncbi:hypothetical protein O9H85_14955 [Paenibacillus filicis]|uniref:Uncharacterized protein n=1 Tax=Paenibacillus gyeongsangnamensis TaxID=3388067 RepID=A0ABT4Q9Z9_9BACL|nr:hypothetical protein [Paenibacillus filicis]MCZ8513708.1 hypothetical protein [Paenibacillus filicis]